MNFGEYPGRKATTRHTSPRSRARRRCVAQEAGARIYYGGSYGLSIRVRCEEVPQPISVAWLYSRKGVGWQRTREFTLGAALYEHDLPDDKRSHVEEYLDELRAAPFMREVSSKGVQAWAVQHEVAVEHQEWLTGLLRRIIKGLG